MTTPLMPYAVPYEPSRGGYAMTIPEGFRNTSSAVQFSVPAGIVMLRFTWNGLEGVRYQIERGTGSAWTTVIPTSSTITPRTSKIIELSFAAPETITVQSNLPVSQESIDAGAMAGVMVVPLGASPF